MRCLHNRRKALARHMRVALSGRYVGMPEQRLHTPEVGAALDKMGREGMPQDMGRQPFGVYSCSQSELFQQLMTAPTREVALRATRREEILRGCLVPGRQEYWPDLQIFLNRDASRFAQWNQSFPSPFTPNKNAVLPSSDGVQRQANQFADAQARRVEHLHNAVQTLCFRRIGGLAARCINQRQAFRGRQSFRQWTSGPRRVDRAA